MKFIKRVIDIIRDPGTKFRERVFLMITIIAIFALFAVFIGDILIGENIVEIVMLGATLLIVPFITGFSVKYHKAKLGSFIIVLGIAFVILPISFFFGGGVMGGSIVWFSFGFLYIGMVMTGALRVAMMLVLALIAVAEYGLSYFFPNLVVAHNTKTFMLDSLLAVVIVGAVIYTMVWFQTKMFREENARAKEAIKEAGELNRSQNRFFSSMSHEIRTPINTILGLNELTIRRDDVPEEVIGYARNIQGSGKMLLAIINDILDMSKIESGKMDIVPVSYSVGDLMTEIVNMVWSRTKEKGLEFKVDIDPGTPTELFGDEVRIKQVMINLLNNAVKYTKRGSITLHVESERIEGNKVILTIAVSDTGMGIKKESIPYLFDAFKRVDEEKNRNIEGTGLGLSIVKQIVDLMGGEIQVNSVYTQGSTFTIKITQEIVNDTKIGNLNIEARNKRKGAMAYRQSFEAPSANILIVDDNYLNIVVESKLIAPTKVNIFSAGSGADALKQTLTNRFDVIFMDHLMPEMDGIECLKLIRTQQGGLNLSTPVIVLTANAGSENQELYRVSGFDDYLVKPVSGALMEAALVKFIPESKVIRMDKREEVGEGIWTASKYSRKASVLITTDSVCDLPYGVIKKLHLNVMPYLVNTDYGLFYDDVETSSDEIVKYVMSGKNWAKSEPPGETEYGRFFAACLKKAHNIIHISMARNSSKGYEMASAAAMSFDNVKVLDSTVLSSSLGLLVLNGYRMVQDGFSADEIYRRLDAMKSSINCSFIINTTEYMMRSGKISAKVHEICKSLLLHPLIRLKNSYMGVGRIYMGTFDSCAKKYIRKTLKNRLRIDDEVLFVTYVGLEENELKNLKYYIKKKVDFKRIVFQKASSSIAANCGPGAFGLLFMKKNAFSRSIGNLIPEEYDYDESKIVISHEGKTENKAENKASSESYSEKGSSDNAKPLVTEDTKTGNTKTEGTKTEDTKTGSEEDKFAELLSSKGIDVKTGYNNCGGEASYKPVLQIFYDSIDSKSKEIGFFFTSEDWENYAIKVHALKSSARIIGAGKFADKAQQLEDAGKAQNADFIKKNHEKFMEEYSGFKSVLDVFFKKEEKSIEKPFADAFIIESAYDTILEYANLMDTESIEKALEELDVFSLPGEDEEVFGQIKEKLDVFDYDGIKTLIQDYNSRRNR